MRRAIFILLVSLLLATITNVGLCWWLAWKHWEYPPGLEETIGWSGGGEEPAWYFRSRAMFGSTRTDAIPATAWAASGGDAMDNDADAATLPPGSVFYTPPTETDFGERRRYEDARGWPWRAMRSVIAEVRAPPNTPGGGWVYEVREGEELATPAVPRSWRAPFPHLLPTRFMWRGMILNTIAHTLLLVPLVIVMYALALFALNTRKRRRRKRGCCEHCGYDLRGSRIGIGCPECGAGRRRRRPEAA